MRNLAFQTDSPVWQADRGRNEFVNIAAYRFVDLSDLTERRVDLLSLCKRLGLKGTILLSTEGINLFVVGTRGAIDEFLARVKSDPALADLEVKESVSDHQPFNRMLVKIKDEIIAFGVDEIDPARKTSRRLSPAELKTWLDEGRAVTLLDVRNDFEFDLGTFENARPVGINDFRSFPNAVGDLPHDMKEQPVVTFCTGGIRCEKAGPYLEQQGFTNVYQLDGGILKYFEQCGSAHFRGECFVFDKRVALDSTLSETDTNLCFVCHATLSAEDCQSDQYVYGESCPHCYQSDQQKLAATIEKRHRAIRRAASPLPGSQPYENLRPIHVPQRLDGAMVIDFLTEITSRLSREEWLQEIDAGRLKIDGKSVGAHHVVGAGECLIHIMPQTVEPEVNGDIQIVYEDESIVVVNKPAPLPMHPCGRFNRNTLRHLLNTAYDPVRLRPAHRLDAATTGVVVMSKTRRMAGKLQPQFATGEVTKEYLVRVEGIPPSDLFSSSEPISSEKSKAGTRTTNERGLAAHTDFEVVRGFADGTTLIRARPKTGRTNQIRIHLAELNLPVCGDQQYCVAQQSDMPLSDSAASPMCLHAYRIGFRHPQTNEAVEFAAPEPTWCEGN